MLTFTRPDIDYYAFRKLGYHDYHTLGVIHAVYREITAIPLKIDEPLVAKQTLAFWQNDLQAAYAHKATHPTLQAFSEVLKTHELPQSLWETIFCAVEMDIDGVQCLTGDDLKRYAQKKRGSLMQLWAQALNPKTVDTETLNAMGQVIETIHIVQSFSQHKTFYARLLPQDLLEQHGATRYELNSDPLVASLADLLQRSLNSSAALHTPVKSLQTYFNLYHALGKLLLENPAELITQRVDLSPLAKLFLSFKFQLKGLARERI